MYVHHRGAQPLTDALLDELLLLGALDVEGGPDGFEAILPAAAGLPGPPARPRDAGSTWVLRPRPVRAGRWLLGDGGLRLHDDDTFGSGGHVTTRLALEGMERALEAGARGPTLDVGTGSGVLALAACAFGEACGVDVDRAALASAQANAALNGLTIELRHDLPARRFGLLVANIVSAELIALAPTLVRRVDHAGWVVLSGVGHRSATDVRSAWTHQGLHPRGELREGDWVALLFEAPW